MDPNRAGPDPEAVPEARRLPLNTAAGTGVLPLTTLGGAGE
jgi:hypothetical protein